MKISEVLRRALTGRRRPSTPSRDREADERRGAEQAKAWQSPGGPIDPGFVA